ncbi:hypothetical protein BJY01DRAFT_204650 [Aspergillus pseudoustus]|uniref:Uncharacterized protein n=1 Tax=Aspergillus pseudoustus TaxID=1810923 RepID=A0ABR4KRN6_9EURO
MHHTNYEDLASAGKSPHVLGPTEINALIEVTRQRSPFQTVDPRSIERRSNSPGESFSGQVEGMKEGSDNGVIENVNSISRENTVTRGTQTDPGISKHMHATGAIHVSTSLPSAKQNPPQDQENIVPNRAVDPPPQQPWQDPFISAMFPEATAPVYDPKDQARRGMRGINNPPARRGRIARTQHGMAGQLVHPTMADATVFQEYVHRLIAELDCAP